MSKIIFFSNTVLEHGGGHEQSLMEMAEELARDGRNSVEICTMDELFAEKLGRLLNIYYLKRITSAPLKRESFAYVQKQIGKATYTKCSSITQLRTKLSVADIVISKNELLECVLLKFGVRKKNINNLVFDCATCLKYPYSVSLQAKIHNLLYGSFIYKFLANMVDQFIVKNTIEQNTYTQLFPNARVTLIYNTFDFSNKISKPVEPMLGRPAIILWVGRLTEQKGVSDLLTVINLANQAGHSDWQWHIAGEGEEAGRVRRHASMNPNITYFGHVKNNALRKMYRDADVFISTSKWESFGNVIIEAIANETPVVCRNIPGPSDILIDGVNGYFADGLADYITAIERLLANPDNFRDISDTVISKFSKKSASQLLSIISSL